MFYIPFQFGGHHYLWARDRKIYLMKDGDKSDEHVLTESETEEGTQNNYVFIEYTGQSIDDLKKELSELAQKHLTAKSE